MIFRAGHVAVGQVDHRAVRDFLQRHQAAGGGQGPNAVLREGIVGNVGLAEDGHAGGHVADAHERADYRLVDALDRIGHDGGRLFNLGHRLRREDDDAHVYARIFQHGADSGLVAIAAGVADDVDGVAERSGGGQRGAKLVLGGLAQLGQLEAVADRGVGGHDAGAPGVGDDRHPRPLGQRLGGVEGRVVEQFGDRVDALHAALGQQRVVHRVGTCQRTGVAADGLGALQPTGPTSGKASVCASPRRSCGPAR